MTRKKPALTLRRPADPIDPLQAERFVRGLATPEPAQKEPVAETPRRLDVQGSLTKPVPSAPIPSAPAPSVSKSLVYRKRTDDVRRRMTIYLSEDLSRRLRLYAAEKDQDYSVILAEALDALLDRKGVQ